MKQIAEASGKNERTNNSSGSGRYTGQISSASLEQMQAEFSLIALYVGIDEPTKMESTVLVEFLKSQFGRMMLSDVSEAVKLALADKLPDLNIDFIRKMSSGWFGKILTAYKKQKTERNRLNDPITPESLSVERISQFTGIDGKERGYYETLEKWYLEHGNTMPPFGWAYGHARKWLKNNGLLVKAEDKAEVERLALDHIRSLPTILQGGRTVKRKLEQIYLDRAVCELHLKRKFTIG